MPAANATIRIDADSTISATRRMTPSRLTPVRLFGASLRQRRCQVVIRRRLLEGWPHDLHVVLGLECAQRILVGVFPSHEVALEACRRHASDEHSRL